MKKHEQQTSRLEKIRDFFGGSNFLRLNNYLKLSAWRSVILLFSLWRSAVY